LNSTETKDCTREIAIEIPADVVAGETNRTVEKYQRLARVPGFRRGKVPATIIRQRFGDDIRTEVAEALVPKALRDEAEKQGLKPVSQPRVTDMHLHEGEPLRFKATFEVLPEIEISGYDDIRVEHPDNTISDQEVEEALSNLREQHASFDPVNEERPLQDGDFAQVSFEGRAKDAEEANEPVKVDEIMVEVGGSNTVNEFSENLRGAKPGEQRTFDVAYAEDFQDKRLAGKTMAYTLDVKSIKHKHLPELTDDFAKEIGSFATLDELKQRIRESIEAEKKHKAEHEGKDKITDELLKRYDFAVPESLVEQQINTRLERGLRALAAQGMRPEDMKRMDFGRLRAGQRDQAVREVKTYLILDKIADQDHIEVTDEEVEKEIEAIAAQSNTTADQIRDRFKNEGMLDRIRDRIRNEKTLDELYRKSV
jgi:trigger factor